MNYISLFSGIGAFEKAFKKIDNNMNLLFFSEIDKYAEKSYCLIHEEDNNKNLGDITKISDDILNNYNTDILTYGFPCQPFSLAGERKGFIDRLNRGLMFFEALRVISITKPKIAIAENVANLKNFNKEFNYMLSCLEELGYTNKIIEVNSKNIGSPQNRERIFIISVLDEHLLKLEGRINKGPTLQDILIDYDKADSKYYLKDDYFIGDIPNDCIIEDFYANRPIRIYTEYSPALRATRYGLKVKQNNKFRKLTPEEGFYLQGFTKEDFNRVKDKISNTQLWKQIGNSIDIRALDYVLSFIDFNQLIDN